jgi:hypothetical protein
MPDRSEGYPRSGRLRRRAFGFGRSLHAGCAGMSLRRNLRLPLVTVFGKRKKVTARASAR